MIFKLKLKPIDWIKLQLHIIINCTEKGCVLNDTDLLLLSYVKHYGIEQGRKMFRTDEISISVNSINNSLSRLRKKGLLINNELNPKIILKETDEKSLGLTKKIPIHLVYLTSWVDENDVLQFREDIYNYDSMQKEFLY